MNNNGVCKAAPGKAGGSEPEAGHIFFTPFLQNLISEPPRVRAKKKEYLFDGNLLDQDHL